MAERPVALPPWTCPAESSCPAIVRISLALMATSSTCMSSPRRHLQTHEGRPSGRLRALVRFGKQNEHVFRLIEPECEHKSRAGRWHLPPRRWCLGFETVQQRLTRRDAGIVPDRANRVCNALRGLQHWDFDGPSRHLNPDPSLIWRQRRDDEFHRLSGAEPASREFRAT